MPGPPGAVAAVGALTGGPSPFKAQRTEVRFVGPAGMKISWFVPGPDGKVAPSPQYLEAPGRYNFMQAAIYAGVPAAVAAFRCAREVFASKE